MSEHDDIRSPAARAGGVGPQSRAARGEELRPLVRLAWPVVTAEIGWVTMWLVDTMMVGRVSAEAIGAVSLGGHVFYTVATFGIGMLLGLDYLVAHAFGAGRLADSHRALVHGLYLAGTLTVVLTAIILAAIPLLDDLGIHPAVLAEAVPYLKASLIGLLPLLVFAALRRYLQALGAVKPIMVILLTANLVNALADWILVFGRLGAPALGAVGAGWATTVSRLYMCGALALYILQRERRKPTGLLTAPRRVDPRLVRRLVGLGLPAAVQTSLEIGVFAAATMLAASLAPEAVAAHQVALGAAALTFMVPLGVSSAAAVRVGQALGRGEPAAGRRAGWASLVVGGGFMLGAALLFLVAPRTIARAFTSEAVVVATAVSLLRVAALFQLFDGLQVVATGALRGTGDTRTPMLANLVGHWLLGLPVGYALGFWWGWGIVGLWIGLSVGLIAVALTLVLRWARVGAELAHPRAPLRPARVGAPVPAA